MSSRDFTVTVVTSPDNCKKMVTVISKIISKKKTFYVDLLNTQYEVM